MSLYDIAVSVAPSYISDRSDATHNRYAFEYRVTVKNIGQVSAQLVGRHWLVVDSEGTKQEIRGLGVVGKQPLLQPGESFDYTSWTSLATAVGSMQGEFLFVTEDCRTFHIPIHEFTLAMPKSLH